MIIGINGRIGAGKDTLGMMLQALTMRPGIGSRWSADPIGYAEAYRGTPNLKGGWHIAKFATKLKQFAAQVLGVPVEKFEDHEFKSSILGPQWNYHVEGAHTLFGRFYEPEEGRQMTVREFLQKLGQSVRDGIHPNFWVNALFADYNPEDNWIITDVRYPNEADRIRELGGVVYQVQRPENPYPESDHESETALLQYPNFKGTVFNQSYEHLMIAARGILLNAGFYK